MMKKTRKKIPSVIALSLVVATLMVMTSGIASAAGVSVLTATPAGQSIHTKINMSEITGEIAEPPQLTSAASAAAKEKEWYEYIYYSPEPVAQYYMGDNARLTFYDPYDYADALIMEVNDTITDWSSMNTLQISYTTGNSLTTTDGSTTETNSSVQIAMGKDVTETNTNESTVTTTVEGNVKTYNYSKNGEKHSETDDETWTVSETLTTGEKFPVLGTKLEVSVQNTNNFGLVKTREWEDEEYNYDGEKFSGYNTGYTDDDTTTTSVTDAGYSKTTSTIADRLTTAVGNSASTSISMVTDNSTTITKTYDAAYFNASGSPLQWKIIQYTVKMPMKYQIEYLVDGEWIFGDYNYCQLNTIQGTCRAWLQNSVAYYEHWGNGEPVTWNEFWNQFFTEESLVQAYQNKLYPDN